MTQHSEKQFAIISAAIEEFAKRGLEATTMEAICSSASVSKRTLYKHYSNKEALFDAVVELLIDRIRPLTDIQFIPNYDFKVQLQHLAKSAVSLLNDEDYLRLSRIVMIESLRCEAQAIRLNQKFNSCESTLAQWFVEAKEAGCLGEFSAEFSANFFWGSLKRLAYWDRAVKWQAPLSEAELDDLVENACALFCLGTTPRQ